MQTMYCEKDINHNCDITILLDIMRQTQSTNHNNKIVVVESEAMNGNK